MKKQPDPKKILSLLRLKRAELKKREPPDPRRWTRYLKETGIRRVAVTGLAKMANGGELDGKSVVQTDIFLSEPARKIEELEGMDARDLSFLVMDRETAEKILFIGLP